MRITIFEGTIVKFKSGRYQHAEITCHSDFTAPRLVIYTYKRSTRWFFTIRRRPDKKHLGPTAPPATDRFHADSVSNSPMQQQKQQSCNSRHRILRIEAEMHGLDDLFHVAPVGLHRSAKRHRLPTTRGGWYRKPETNLLPVNGKPPHLELNSVKMDLEPPSPVPPPSSPFSRSESLVEPMINNHAGELSALELFLESGETCTLHLESGLSRDECVRALHCILGKNKLIRGYPDIDFAWTVKLRYKMQRSPTSSLAPLMHNVTSNVGQRFFCLTASEFLIVSCNLRAPDLVCPYSFVRQCASRKDGQFRIQLGRASPLGECELVIQLADCTEARFVHECFARLMNQSGTRYRDGRSSFLTDLSTEFITNFPPLPRPTTLMSTATSNNTSEVERSRVSFEQNSNNSEEAHKEHKGPCELTLTNDTTSVKRSSFEPRARHSWPRMRLEKQLHHPSEPEMLRATHKLHGRETRSLENVVFPIALSKSYPSENAPETCNHYLEMTDEFEVLQPSNRLLARSSHSERTSVRKGLDRQRRSSFSNGQIEQPFASLVTVLRHRSNQVRATKRSFPAASRPTSHREDDTLFADVVFEPQLQPYPNLAGFGVVTSRNQRQSLTVLRNSIAPESTNTMTMCTREVHTRLRAMSDVSALRPQVHATTACYSLHNPEHKWSTASRNLYPTVAGSRLSQTTEDGMEEGNRDATTNRFSFSSFLSSVVNSSTRNSCVATTTPASCSNLKTSYDLIRMREKTVGREVSTEQEMRPRATTIGPSVLIGQRLAMSAHVARWASRLAHVTSGCAGRTKHEPSNAGLVANPQTLTRSELNASACPTPDLPPEPGKQQQQQQDIPLTFADHYIL